MRRIFTNNDLKTGTDILLEKEEAHYLKNVLRLTKNDQVLIFNGKEKNEFVAIIKEISPSAILKVTEKRPISIDNETHITLAFALPKGPKTDLIIQKGTEIGIDTFIPFFSERTIISKLDTAKEAKKTERWNKIAIAASKQCRRTLIPKITPISNIKDLLNQDTDLTLIASLSKNIKPLRAILSTPHKKIVVIVGPEGGFTDTELALFSKAPNTFFFSLGDNVLRAETAALIAPALVKYETKIINKN